MLGFPVTVIGCAVAIVGPFLVGGADRGAEGDPEEVFVEELDPAAHVG